MKTHANNENKKASEKETATNIFLENMFMA